MPKRNEEYEKTKELGRKIYELIERSDLSVPNTIYALTDVIATLVAASPSRAIKRDLLQRAGELLPKLVKSYPDRASLAGLISETRQ